MILAIKVVAQGTCEGNTIPIGVSVAEFWLQWPTANPAVAI